MFQAIIFFDNGSVMRTAPADLVEAQEFAKSFEKTRDDIVEIFFVNAGGQVAREQYAQLAQSWEDLARRNRNATTFDREKDKLALTFVNTMKQLAA